MRKWFYVLEEHTWFVPSAYPRLCIEVSRQLYCKTNHEFFTRNGYTSWRIR